MSETRKEKPKPTPAGFAIELPGVKLSVGNLSALLTFAILIAIICGLIAYLVATKNESVTSVIRTLNPRGDIIPSSEKEELPPKIVVHPKHYLSHAPLLSTLDPYILIVSTERGTRFDWVYTLSYVGQYNSDWKSIRYRVEILY